MLTKERLHIRAAFFQAVRDFFHKQEFIEVDTPLLHPVLIPEANIVPISFKNRYLQTSPEICMKRILALDCPKIFQICRCFRKDEKGNKHLEEFSMLEWYRLESNYIDLMDDCKKLIESIVLSLQSIYPREISWELPQLKEWQNISVEQAFQKHSPVPLNEAMNRGMFEEYLVEFVEPNLGIGAPTFLCDYPSEMASLAKRKNGEPEVAERFELYINGIELANGFSELTDQHEQRARFKEELTLIHTEKRDSGGMPEKFLECLPDIGDAAGIAMGLDRLLMLILGEETISDVVSFTPEDL